MLGWQKDMADFLLGKTKIETLPKYQGALKLNGAEALKYYKSSYRDKLQELIEDKYSESLKALRLESNKPFVELFVKDNPSRCVSLDDYGDSFPEFLDDHGVSGQLVDLAQLELQVETLSGTVPYGRPANPLDLEKKLCIQNTKIYVSKYDLMALWMGEKTSENFQEYYILIYFGDEKVGVRGLRPWQFHFLQKCLPGTMTLSELIDAIDIEEDPGGVQNFFGFLTEQNIIANTPKT